MSVVVILLMFLAVMVMVKRVDDDRLGRAIVVPDSSEMENGISPQTD